MQGHRSSSLTSLPENISFDHGSTDTSIDSQLPWNTIHPSAPNRLPSNDTNTQFFSHLRHNGQSSQWSLGEASSSASQNHAYGNEGKIEQQARSLHSPLENNDVNLDGPHTTNGPFLLQNSTRDPISQDLNMILTFGENEDDDACQIVEHPNTSRRISCKRKAIEVQVGQSSASASSSSFQNAPNNIITPTHTQTELVFNNGPEQANPRLRLGVGGNPFSSTNLESSGRNFRVRINGLPHQEAPISTNPFLGEADVGNRDVSSSSSRHSARLLRNHLLDLNPVPSMENGIPLDQYAPPLRGNSQTRCSRGSSSRTNRASVPPISEPTNLPIPRTISEHPIFIQPPANEIGSSSEHNTTWNLGGGGNSSNIGNAVSATGPGSSSGGPGSSSVANMSAADWARRHRQNYPRRLSEIVRRSQLSSAGNDSGFGGSANHGIGSSSSLTAQEMALLSGTHSHDRHAASSRAAAAMLERNVDGAFGLPYSLRTLAAGSSEGRSSIMSEIRHVLNLMRRGEGLRIEDVMLLDHSVFFGMADIHDRHRDMRLDVDNMSYEELLALEERIGNVCTGLSEETIINGLKQHKYFADNGSRTDRVETEPCSICREEYNDGEDLGRLECGHDFHKDCIMQWLVHKNSCPICKKAGLST